MALILRQCLDELDLRDVIPANPFNKIRFAKGTFVPIHKKEAEDQVFSCSEIEAVMALAAAKFKKTDDESFLTIPLTYLLGLRVGECLALSFSDFDRETGEVRVHRTFAVQEERTTDGGWEERKYVSREGLKKGHDERIVAAPDQVFEIVDDIKKCLRRKKIVRNNLFCVMTPGNVGKKLYKICDDLKIKRRSFHKLRKTYVSVLFARSLNPEVIRQQVGHEDLETTYNSYVYATRKSNELVDQLNKALGGNFWEPSPEKKKTEETA